MLLVVELFSYLAFSLPPKDEHGRTWYWTFSETAPFVLVYLVDYALLALGLATFAILLVFLVSGSGWINAGSIKIGLLILFVRGYVSLGVLAYFVGEAGPLEAAMYFIASLTLAACSALVLAVVTRSRAGASAG